MNRDDRRVLRRAAKMLLVNAAEIREPCQSGREKWACGTCPARDARGICASQREHDAHVRTADQLKAMARS